MTWFALLWLAAAQPQAIYDRRAEAWDRSVALEAAGRTSDAQAVLEAAWGRESESYEVCVRLAWLSLQAGQTQEAAAYYRRALALSGAGPEATQGLIMALTALGYQKLEAGDRHAARGAFRQALELAPEQPAARRGLVLARRRSLGLEVWAGGVHDRLETSTGTGAAAFVQLPVWFSESVTGRVAARHARLSFDVPGDPADSNRRRRAGQGAPSADADTIRVGWQQTDFYAAVGLVRPQAWAELLAFAILADGEQTAVGQALRAGLGRWYGVSLEQALLQRELGTSLQLVPGAFAWPTRWAGLGAGARITRDPQGTAVSAVAGLTLLGANVRADVSGYMGPQRWAVSPLQPSVRTTPGDAVWGGTATVLVPLTLTFSIGLQGEFSALEFPTTTGRYATVSGGAVWTL